MRKVRRDFLLSMTLCHRRHTIPAGTIVQKVEKMESNTQPQLLWCKRERWRCPRRACPACPGVRRRRTGRRMRPSNHIAREDGATTSSSQWRRDARASLGLLLFGHWGLWPPPFCAIPTLIREYLFSWQSERSLFGMPAWGPSRPLPRLVGSLVAALHSC